MFVATEESLSRCRDPSLRSGRHASFLSSDFAKALEWVIKEQVMFWTSRIRMVAHFYLLQEHAVK